MARKLSEEHKEKLRQGRLKAQAEKATLTEVADVPAKEPTPQAPVVQAVDPNLIAAIVQTVMALQQQNPQAINATPEQKLDETAKHLTTDQANYARISANGVQGVVFKFPVDSEYYADPTDRLYDEPSLKRFAMRENYIFRWAVDGETYVKNGVTFSEPRFTIELFKRLYDEDGNPQINPKTGHPTMALVARQFQHEDELTTRVAAQRLGILEKYANDERGFKLLMDEIRYYRIQNWLLAVFSKAKISTFNRQSRTMNINGEIVEVFDTEKLTDPAKAATQTSTLQTTEGIGNIRVPE